MQELVEDYLRGNNIDLYTNYPNLPKQEVWVVEWLYHSTIFATENLAYAYIEEIINSHEEAYLDIEEIRELLKTDKNKAIKQFNNQSGYKIKIHNQKVCIE